MRLQRGRWLGVCRLWLPGKVAGTGLGEDPEFDLAFQLGAGAFDVLGQQFVAEGFADVLGPERRVVSLNAARMRGWSGFSSRSGVWAGSRPARPVTVVQVIARCSRRVSASATTRGSARWAY
ncbi:hypothetical protein ADK87_14665 [Streptomyces sp. NRRL F-4711]|nr:hypothetical protein ADK87_14665 [Streptomyces sp. NRRL F-4711]